LVGLFGAFDTGELGEVALRRVLEWELTRRRPDITLMALAPFGAERPVPGDEGRPALPLTRMSGADPVALDAMLIAGDVLGDDHQWAVRYPVADEAMTERGVGSLVLSGRLRERDAAKSVTWFGVGLAGDDVDLTALGGSDVWARDQATQQHIGGTSAQSGDPLLMARRFFQSEVLRKRVDLLRLCGAVPAGRRIVVEVAPSLPASASCERLVEAVSAALRADPKLSVVVVDLKPTRQPNTLETFRVPGLLAERVHRLPVWAGLDDIAAAMSGSAAMIATSPAAAHIAASLGVPVAAVDTGIGDRFDPSIPVLAADVSAMQGFLGNGQPASIDAAMQTLDGALAELAERLPRGAGSPRPSVDPERIDSALCVLQRRLADERTALQAELSRVQSELDHLRESPEHRITRPIREGYQRWQRRRT
jgi:ethanolamine utilization microcompartment shell protein EutS